MSDKVLLSKILKKGIEEKRAIELLSQIHPDEKKKIVAFPMLLDKLLKELLIQ